MARPVGSAGRKPSADGLPNMWPAEGEPMSGAQRPRDSAGRNPSAKGGGVTFGRIEGNERRTETLRFGG